MARNAAILVLVVIGVLVGDQRRAAAQDPFPTGLARSTEPGQPEPPDGAEVLIVEGTNAGAEGCDPSVDLIKYVTVLSINSARPTTDFMVLLTQGYRSATGQPVLVTWSLHPDYQEDFRSLYRAESRVGGPPFTRWALNLSNCFTTGTTPCGPDSDDDGLVNGIEVLGGTNPNDKDTDDDGCSDGEETGIDRIFGGERDAKNFWDFFDVTGDKSVDLSDTLNVLTFFGDPGLPGTPGDLRDRQLDATGWRSAESNGGVDLTDALVALQQFGMGCQDPP